MILVEEKGVLKLRLETEDIQATMKEQMAKCYGNRQGDIFRRCINPKKGGLFWQLRRRGGSYVPTDKQSTAEATIFILHQQSASHIKGVMFSVHLRPW